MEAPKGSGFAEVKEVLEGEKAFLFEQIRRTYCDLYPDMPATLVSDIAAHSSLFVLDVLSDYFGDGAKIYLLSSLSKRLWAEAEGVDIDLSWAHPAPEDGRERESSATTDCAVPHPAPSEHPHPLGASPHCHPPPVHPAAGDGGTTT